MVSLGLVFHLLLEQAFHRELVYHLALACCPFWLEHPAYWDRNLSL
jgi:hypothetical protein